MTNLEKLILRAVKANNGTARVPFRIRTMIQLGETNFYVKALGPDDAPFEEVPQEVRDYLVGDLPEYCVVSQFPTGSMQGIQVVILDTLLRHHYMEKHHLFGN